MIDVEAKILSRGAFPHQASHLTSPYTFSWTGRHQTTGWIIIIFLRIFTAANVCNAITVMIHDCSRGGAAFSNMMVTSTYGTALNEASMYMCLW